MTEAFFSTLGKDVGDVRPEVDARLEAMVQEGRATWPSVVLGDAAYFRHVAGCVGDADVLTTLESLAAADLYLACACAHGNNHAIDTLEATYARQIQMALQRLRNNPLLPDDFRQVLRLQLFVGTPDKGPAIARYSGRGTLGAWIRVTALRAALNATRSTRPPESGLAREEELFDFEATPDDPELEHLKQTYRAAFRQAFLDTLEGLSGRDKTLLRQSVMHGLSVREIARMHGVHHATVARWLANARSMLLEGTRTVLAERLRVSGQELDSIMGLIESRLEVSIARVLGDG